MDALDLDNRVGIFFLVEGNTLLHTCMLDEAKSEGGLLVYPDSHEDVWNRYHKGRYGEDYDYFPRGRIVYCEEYDYFLLYYNHCSRHIIPELHSRYRTKNCQLAYDLSYRCHQCRPKRSSGLCRWLRRRGVGV